VRKHPLPVNGSERRRFVRYELNVDVELVIDGRSHRCRSEDLGAGGCRIQVPAAIERDRLVEVRLSSAAAAAHICGEATVAWVSQLAPHQVGLAFSDPLSEQAIPFIHAVLAAAPRAG
jgi:hypothetical protein